MSDSLSANRKIAVHTSHRVHASQPNAQGQYDWHYEYDLIEFLDEKSHQKLTARSDSTALTEASFIDLKTHRNHQIALNAHALPLFKFAITYLEALGKTKIHYLSEFGYALSAPAV